MTTLRSLIHYAIKAKAKENEEGTTGPRYILLSLSDQVRSFRQKFVNVL